MISKEKKHRAIVDLINKMFEISGYDLKYEDVEKLEDEFYDKYTMTSAQYDEWEQWAINYLRQKFRWTKALAKKEVGWFALGYALRVRSQD